MYTGLFASGLAPTWRNPGAPPYWLEVSPTASFSLLRQCGREFQ